MSICPKNKSSKARRDKLEDDSSWLGKVQQVWSAYDATQSMQGLRFL